MMHTIVKQSSGNIQVVYGGDLAQSGNTDALGHPNPTQEDLDKFVSIAKITSELGLTGASVEIVVRRAVEIAYEEAIDAQLDPVAADQVPAVEARHLFLAVHDFKPNHNRTMYDYQSLLAIRACNFHSVIPTLPRTGVYGRIQRPDGTIDPEQLEEEIQLIQQRGL